MAKISFHKLLSLDLFVARGLTDLKVLHDEVAACHRNDGLNNKNRSNLLSVAG
jgi:hypothetical protein